MWHTCRPPEHQTPQGAKTMQRQTAVTDGEKWPTNSKMYLASVQTFGSLCLPKTARGLCPHSARALVATDTRHQDARPRALAMQQLHGQDCTAVSRGSWLSSRVRSHPYLTVALSTRLSECLNSVSSVNWQNQERDLDVCAVHPSLVHTQDIVVIALCTSATFLCQ